MDGPGVNEETLTLVQYVEGNCRFHSDGGCIVLDRVTAVCYGVLADVSSCEAASIMCSPLADVGLCHMMSLDCSWYFAFRSFA